MKLSSLIAVGVVSITSFSFAAQTPPAPAYQISELPAASGADFLQPRKINNRGDVLGKLDFSSGPYKDVPHAGFFSQGGTIDLHLLVPGGQTNQNSLDIDLNDNGQALFRAYGGITWSRFFLYDQGQLTELNEVLGRNDVDFVAMNNAGDLVGTTIANIVNEDVGEAFLYADGQFKTLGLLPGLPQSIAVGINDRGTIVGWAGNEDMPELSRPVTFRPHHVSVIRHLPDGAYVIDINNRGDLLGNTFVRRGGRIVKLPFPPSGFNNRGHVVGSRIDVNFPPVLSRAVLFSNGETRDLNELIDPTLGWKLFYGYDINDRGQIVGWGRLNDHWAGFILTPTE